MTGKGMMQVLLDQSMMSGLCLVLQYCACRRLCTNQVLITLSYQQYPISRGAQIIRPGRVCLPVEQSWQPASFEYFQLRLWQACQWSPHASTVRISLSSALQAKPELEILLGVTTARATWDPATQLSAGDVTAGRYWACKLYTGYGTCRSVRWCATLEDAPRMPCSPISFQGSAPCATTLGRLVIPSRSWGQEARVGFAGGADNVPSTLLDQVSPSATSSEAAAAAPLMNRMPKSFNEAFLLVWHWSHKRALIVVRYLLADLIPIPENKVRSALPDICCVTSSLAAKAGCPFEWAFLLFLPILATACSKARLLIDEIFLVPPLLWLGLCLESGANKSAAMTALLNIIFAFGNLNVFS